MDEKNFQLFLKGNGIKNSSIINFLSKLKDYETYLENQNLNLDLVDPKSLYQYTEYLVSTDKEAVLDFLRAILSYADYTKRYDFITNAIDIYESYNAMDNLYARIAEIYGEQIKDEIFKNMTIPPLGVHPEKKPDFTKKILVRIEEKLGEKKTIELLKPCLHGRPPDDIEGDKKLLTELGIDAFLLKKHNELIKRLEEHRDEGTLEFAQKVDDEVINFIKNNQMYGSGLRKGDLILISKIPYQTKKLISTEDDKMKKFYLCYCPWVRGALKEGSDGDLSNYFCNCSAGWYKLYWDQIFEQSVIVEPIKTALNGDLECSFAVHIPENLLNKIT
jgi:hypothetical protein